MQVPRASASAVAFSQGLFPCSNEPCLEDTCGPQECCIPQPVPLSMAPKHSDPLLRFFDICPAYDAYQAQLQPALGAWAEGLWQGLTSRIELRLQAPAGSVTPRLVAALWQYCQQEAGLLDTINRVCSLFSEEVLSSSKPCCPSIVASRV